MARTDDWIMNQTGHKPNGIAMDGVRLVDVTDGFPNANMREDVL